VHLSSTEELQFLDPVHGETRRTASVTPHHLFFNDADSLNGARPNPPPRPENDRRSLWTAVKRGRLDCLSSDHHPSHAGASDGGLPSTELLLPLLLSAVQNGRLSMERLVELCCEAPARIFGLSTKGHIVKGHDADLVLFSEGQSSRVQADALLSTAGWSPYSDRESAPKPDVVIIGGRVVARRGFIVAERPNGAHALP
jgi:dihydroorotase